ncbi:MAG: hypothetical protein E7Z86_06870 [Methanosphaera stadtmanae]|nr:hypothetical protein [Methanosphaera stadtmanae]
MDKLVKTIIKTSFENITNSTIPLNEQVGLIVEYKNVKFEFLINIKTSTDNLICLGSGAYPLDKSKIDKTKPWFNRWSWNFDEFSTIHYNDPSLYLYNDKMDAGWGLGTPEDWFLEDIKDILVQLFKKFGFKNENVIFYGSSAGGFTSLQLGIMIKQTNVLADIPQLNLKRWYWDTIKIQFFQTILRKK